MTYCICSTSVADYASLALRIQTREITCTNNTAYCEYARRLRAERLNGKEEP
jgi:hypothetical protein